MPGIPIRSGGYRQAIDSHEDQKPEKAGMKLVIRPLKRYPPVAIRRAALEGNTPLSEGLRQMPEMRTGPIRGIRT
jgi:hypothetical protein